MFEVNEHLGIPENELRWSFVRAGGPGGQNVNKVASKAVLRWNVSRNATLPSDVKARLLSLQRKRVNAEGELILTSQRFRDQGRNVQDCLEKLRNMIRQAAIVPKPRKKTKPTHGARETRLQEKRRRATTKAQRRRPVEE